MIIHAFNRLLQFVIGKLCIFDNLDISVIKFVFQIFGFNKNVINSAVDTPLRIE